MRACCRLAAVAVAVLVHAAVTSAERGSQWEGSFWRELVERGLEDTIPVLECNGVTRFAAFEALELEDFQSLELNLGQLRLMVAWWRSHSATEGTMKTRGAGTGGDLPEVGACRYDSGCGASCAIQCLIAGLNAVNDKLHERRPWGTVTQYLSCSSSLTWQDFRANRTEFEGHSRTGGLGQLMVPYEYENWWCTRYI